MVERITDMTCVWTSACSEFVASIASDIAWAPFHFSADCTERTDAAPESNTSQLSTLNVAFDPIPVSKEGLSTILLQTL